MKNIPISEKKLSKVWLTIGIVLAVAIIYLYHFSVYDSIGMNITREDAEEKASELLTKLGFEVSDYYKESSVAENLLSQLYFLQELNSAEFNKYQDQYVPNHGWRIFFHQNLSPLLPQVNYRVNLNRDGKVLSFSRNIPDTAFLPTISEAEAEETVKKFVEKNTPLDIQNFELTESREERLANRTDYSFRWEKESQYPDGKFILYGKVQGDQMGEYRYSFDIPPGKSTFDNAGGTLIGSLSIIFVFFLTQFAIYNFLKKYHQGEVWVSTGRNFLLLFFLVSVIFLINSWPAVGSEINYGTDVLTTKIITFLGTLFLVYVVLALLLFASWTVGESYSREIWPAKLRGIDAFIKGKIFTLDSGVSALRGFILALGIVFLYMILGLILNNTTGSLVVLNSGLLSRFDSLSPAIDVLSDSFQMAMISSVSVIFLIITLSYQRWKNKTVSILVSAAVFSLSIIVIQFSPSVNNIWLTLLLSFLLGCFYAYLFFKFDLLTIFSIHFHIGLIFGAMILFSSKTEFYQINFAAVIFLMLLTPVMYGISQFRKESFELENYGVPEHVKRISERERLKKELEIASKVQLSLLPKEHPKLEGYDIYGISIPAKEAGGDYYDFVNLSGKNLGIAIGDVSGKGVGAAIYMTLTKGILQAHAEENTSPAKVLSKVNKLLFKTIEKNSFVSMFYSILDYENNILHYSRAGHNPGIYSSFSDKTTKLLKSKGMALGLEEGSIFTNTLVEDEIKLNPGDMIVLYTDGFTEAMNSKLEEFGEARFLDVIKRNEDRSAKELIEKILHDVNKFVEGFPQHDDMTIVVLKCRDNMKS